MVKKKKEWKAENVEENWSASANKNRHKSKRKERRILWINVNKNSERQVGKKERKIMTNEGKEWIILVGSVQCKRNSSSLEKSCCCFWAGCGDVSKKVCSRKGRRVGSELDGTAVNEGEERMWVVWWKNNTVRGEGNLQTVSYAYARGEGKRINRSKKKKREKNDMK